MSQIVKLNTVFFEARNRQEANLSEYRSKILGWEFTETYYKIMIDVLY